MFKSSIVKYPDRGPWGSSKWRGNTTGHIINDFLDFCKGVYGREARSISDYACGSGTTREVAAERKIPGTFLDLHMGFNLLTDDIPDRPETVFFHPPYYGMIVYSGKNGKGMWNEDDVFQKYGIDASKYDMSRMNDEDFVKAMNYCILKQFAAMETGGKMAILMGDRRKNGKYRSMLLDCAKPGEIDSIVIKSQPNTVSGNKTYSSNKFIPIEQEYLLILRKELPYILDFAYQAKSKLDIRDSKDVTWKDVVSSVLEDLGKSATLAEIYSKIDGHKKALANPHWKEKVRQVLQSFDSFRRIGEGVWAIAA